MAWTNTHMNISQGQKTSSGDVMQQEIFNSDRGPLGNIAGRFGAVLAMAGLLLLSACSGSQKDVTQTDQTEPGMDGVPPTMTAVTIQNARDAAPKPNGTVALGQEVRIDIVASEAVMAPVVTINDVPATVTGKVNTWRATRAMTDADVDGPVYFNIQYQDISGEVGVDANATTDGSAAAMLSAVMAPRATAIGMCGVGDSG